MIFVRSNLYSVIDRVIYVTLFLHDKYFSAIVIFSRDYMIRLSAIRKCCFTRQDMTIFGVKVYVDSNYLQMKTSVDFTNIQMIY